MTKSFPHRPPGLDGGGPSRRRAAAQELVTAGSHRQRRRAEVDDVPHQCRFHANTSPQPSQAEGFSQLYPEVRREAIPTGRSTSSIFTPDIGGEHARMLEQARAGRAPGLRDGRFLPARALHQAGRARADRRIFQQGGDRRPLPVHQGRHHRAGRQDLCVVVEHRSARALPQQGVRGERAADLGRAQGGRARGRQEGRRKACSSTAAAGRARPSTGWRISGARAASSSTTAASRSSAKARTARRC